MFSADPSRRTIAFINIAHAVDHFVLLIYPTVVIAIALQRDLAYGELIGLATGAFVAFGLFSLPVGWMADRVGRRNMMIAFFFGCGISCIGLAFSSSTLAFAAWLLVLGIFSAIYHPVGMAMLASHTDRLGRDLGVNGVWGNMGAASASGVSAFLAATLGWQAGFLVPGIVCVLIGIAFTALVRPGPQEPHAATKKKTQETIAVSRPFVLFILFALAIVAGGMTFNVTTISLPKVIDERLGLTLPLVITGSLATAVFVFGAMTQLLMGWLVDRFSLPQLFVGLSILQPAGLALAAMTTGIPMLAGMVLVMAAIYGQVVINDAMVARYVPVEYRARAFGLRYFLGFAAAGFAVPMIAFFHASQGFPLVLGITALFGAAIFLCAVGFWWVSQASHTPSPAPASSG